jgi:seryl-tRNA synthetase
MHDPRALLDPATDAVRRLARRGYQLDLDTLDRLLSGRNSAIGEVEGARAESKRIAQEVQATAKRGEDTGELVERGRA